LNKIVRKDIFLRSRRRVLFGKERK